MNDHGYTIRPGAADDAAAMVQLVNFAGEGMPAYLWERMAESGQSAWDVGHERYRREEGSFSWRRTTVVDHGGRAVAGLVGYPIAREAEPITDETPAMFRPLQELENLAPATWYVNVLAVLPDHRGRGLGRRLLDHAAHLATATASHALSLIVSDANTGARRLYRRTGFREEASRPMVKEGWRNPGSEWILMLRPLG